MISRRRQGPAFHRDRLPDPLAYFEAEGAHLVGRGEWRSMRCPFHNDEHPSCRVNVSSGAFKCFVCGAHGGDVLAFEMQRHDVSFREAAIRLGAWSDR